MSIIDALKDSKNKLLNAEGNAIEKWLKLKHTKEGLELFLTYNIAEISFLGVDGKIHNITCTSNNILIKLFSIVKETDKKKILKLNSTGLNIADKNTVMTWDLIDNKFKKFKLTQWTIKNFITITEENILLLDKMIRELLQTTTK